MPEKPMTLEEAAARIQALVGKGVRIRSYHITYPMFQSKPQYDVDPVTGRGKPIFPPQYLEFGRTKRLAFYEADIERMWTHYFRGRYAKKR